MNDFEKIKETWVNQREDFSMEDVFGAVKKRIKKVGNQQKIANIVLVTTIAVLVFYFFAVSAFKDSQMILGMSMMICSLIVRVAIEVLSIRKLRKLNALLSTSQFKAVLIRYYKERKTVHLVVTPLLFITYILGFVILLPVFKNNLSTGLFWYVVISSIIVFPVLIVFIAKQIQKELRVLELLEKME